jgi:dienelactone hydrolase
MPYHAVVRRRRLAATTLVLAGIIAAATLAYPFLHGLSLVVRAVDLDGPLRVVADIDAAAVRESTAEIPIGGARPVRARVFRAPRAARAVLAVPGLHPTGIDEPRLVHLARALAASNLTVVVPHIPQLSRFEITPAITDAIESAAGWVASQPDLAPDGRLGLVGVSFSGGLAVIAAGRPSLAGKVAYVFSLGGHHDLPRVIAYLSGASREAGQPPPHDYGVAVILFGVADRIVPPDQAGILRAALRRFLWASYLDREDRPGAASEFAALRTVAATLPEPSRTLMEYVNDRDVAALGERLLPHIDGYGTDPSLSPSASPRPDAPVFLLHGARDNVIPASESRRMAASLRGQVPVRLLVTDLISHAEAEPSFRVGQVVGLAAFAADLLSH